MSRQQGISYRSILWFMVASIVLLMAIKFHLGAYVKLGPGVANGLSAKLLCSGVFVSGRDHNNVIEKDILPINVLGQFSQFDIDKTRQEVRVSLYGYAEQKARYTPGYGCTLYQGTPPVFETQELSTIEGFKWEPPSINPKIQALLERILGENADNPSVDTRALLVIKDGRIVGESYQRGYNRDSLFFSWSMAKSITGTLVGIWLDQQGISLDQTLDYPEWQYDERRLITLGHLLTMSSGLSSIETYQPGDNATRMLFFENDMAAYARTAMTHAIPGTQWSYSSATTNILSGWLKEELGSTSVYRQFAWEYLFGPAGMQSAIFEPDASGTFVGSSYLYMTAQDWAKFGQLYLNKGILGTHHILTKDWVEFATTAVDTAPMREYGAHFWLNAGKDGRHLLPDCPTDTVIASGHNGQYLAIVPSENLVVVRLGWSNGVDFDINRHLANIVATVEAEF